MNEEDLQAALDDSLLDGGISAETLLDGVRTRALRLHRRRQHLRTATAAAAAALVIVGTAALAAVTREPLVLPAQQPSGTVVQVPTLTTATPTMSPTSPGATAPIPIPATPTHSVLRGPITDASPVPAPGPGRSGGTFSP